MFSIMRSAFDLLVFIILSSHNFIYERAMCSLEKENRKVTIINIIIIILKPIQPRRRQGITKTLSQNHRQDKKEA